MIKTIFTKVHCIVIASLISTIFLAQTVQAVPTNNDFLFTNGFSNTQGQNQWHYMQWDGSSYSNMNWDGAQSRWKGTPASTLIGQGWMHPDTQDAVLTWKAPRSGTVTVRGVMESRIENPVGSGMATMVKKKSSSAIEQVWPSSGWQNIDRNSTAQHSFKTNVQADDMLYFHLNIGGDNNNAYDTTHWNPHITYDYEPKYFLDKYERVMDAGDFTNIGNTVAMDSSMSIIPNGTNFDFHHSMGSAGNPVKTQKFRGSLGQPAQQAVYNKDVFTNLSSYPGYWWISNTYKTADGNLLAFCHVEDTEELGNGWWGIALAYSTNGGDTFQILGHILGQKVKDDGHNNNIFGIPYVIKDGYFYVYYGEPVAAVARAPIADVLTAAQNGTVTPWYKYYNGNWNEPGMNGNYTPVIPPSTDNDYANHGDAAYSTYLGKNLMTGYTHSNGKGMFLTFSDDGVNFEVPSFIQASNLNNEDSLSPYETIINEDGSDNGQVGQSFYIYYNFRRLMSDQATYRTLYRQKVTLNTPGWEKSKYEANADFGRIQDENTWHYYEYSATSGYANITWDGVQSRWKGSTDYNLVGSDIQHPDVKESVRAWKAPKAGTVTISSTSDFISVGNGSNADGVKVRVMQNNVGLWPLSGSHTVNAGTALGFSPITASVAKGDTLYFHVNQNGNNAYDTTNWTPVVTYQ